jgi:flagellar M-ring protein FliF
MEMSLMQRLSQLLLSPSKNRTFLVATVLLLSAIGFGSLIFWNQRPDYQTLFSNLTQEDAAEIVSKLKERKIPYQLSSSGGAILVPREQVYEIRLALASEGLPKGGGVGFEVFDRTSFGTTDFVQRLNYQRALQGELSRTIRQMKEIEQARVHIVTPKESLFLDEQKKPTASVLIKTRSGMTLAPAQVEGIVHLVASAVEGMEPNNVTVVDTSGRILSKKNDTTLLGQLTATQLEYQRNIEEGLKKKVQGMLEEVLGFNKAIARVSAEVDFQQIDITEERFDPNTVLRSEQKNVERSSVKGTGHSSNKAKSADASASSSEGSLSESERQNEVRNYEVSKVNKKIKSPVGTVKRISVAVIVDGIHKETTDAKGKRQKQYQPRTPEEMKSLENIVKKAIGYDEERGDQIEVLNIPFNLSPLDEEGAGGKTEGWKEYLLIAYKPAVSLVLALLFIFFVVRPLLKKKEVQEAPVPPLLDRPIQPVTVSEVSEAPKGVDLREQALQLVHSDPSKAAGVIKAWLHEKAV